MLCKCLQDTRTACTAAVCCMCSHRVMIRAGGFRLCFRRATRPAKGLLVITFYLRTICHACIACGCRESRQRSLPFLKDAAFSSYALSCSGSHRGVPCVGRNHALPTDCHIVYSCSMYVLNVDGWTHLFEEYTLHTNYTTAVCKGD